MNSSDIIKEQARALEKGIAHAVVTIVSAQGSTPRENGKMLVYGDGSAAGTIGGGAVERIAIKDAAACMRKGRNLYREYDLSSAQSETGMICGGRVSVLIEVYRPKPALVMIGGGHVGNAVLKLASFLDFDTLLVDDRGDDIIGASIAAADRFVRVSDYEAGTAALDIPAGASIVIATHGHVHDGEALAAALSKGAAYLGMIGSVRKVKALFDKMLQKGFSREELAEVHSPIGLDLGGETPEEIAFSIMSEILMAKNGRTGEHMSKRLG